MVPREQLPVILLAVGGAAVTVALALLVVKVQGGPPPPLPLPSPSPVAARAPAPTASTGPVETEPAAPVEAAPAPETPPASGAPSPPAVADPETRLRDTIAAYDRGDYETAVTGALDILNGQPAQLRALRIVVSSSCILGDDDRARQFYARLPAADQKDIAKRCARYGVEF